MCHNEEKVGSTALVNGKQLKIFVFKKTTLLAMKKKWNEEDRYKDIARRVMEYIHKR